jgi:hypothetical protein
MQQQGGGVYGTVYRRIQKRNCMLVVERLKGVRRNNEGGFVSYVAKTNTGAIYKYVKKQRFRGTTFLTRGLDVSMQKSSIGGKWVSRIKISHRR